MITMKRGFSDLKALARTRFSATPPSFLGWVDPEMTWKYEVMHKKLIVNMLKNQPVPYKSVTFKPEPSPL